MKLVSSGLAEMVIALSIISICIALFSVLHVKTLNSNLNFQELKEQTEIQSFIYDINELEQLDSLNILSPNKVKIVQINDKDKITSIWYSVRGLEIWKQDFHFKSFENE